MVTISEMEESSFKLESFNFIIGNNATYNNYYKIILQSEFLETVIGLQTFFVGITPQVELQENYFLLGYSDKFCVYNLNGILLKEYSSNSVFYEFFIKQKNCLVINELSMYLLNYKYEKVWEKDFDDIIDIIEVTDTNINLSKYNGTNLCFDFYTGKSLKY